MSLRRKPYHRFVIQGEGLRGDHDIIGFFTTRDIEASDSLAAGDIALAALRDEWENGASAGISPGNPPRLTILKCWPVKTRRPRAAGHSFYAANLGAMENALEIELEAAEAPP